MSERLRLAPFGTAYLWAVIAIGLGTIGASTFTIIVDGMRADWWLLAALTLLTGSFSLKVPTVSARISVSEAFVFLALLLFGRDVATLIVALDALVLTSWLHGSGRSAIRVLFNMSAAALALSSASWIFLQLVPESSTTFELNPLLLPVAILATTYFAFNSCLIATAVGLATRTSPITIWRRNFAWLILNYLGGASVALLLYPYARDIDLTALSLIVPLLIIIYLTFRTSLGRLEDAAKHVAQLNELYLSTIEALAMAVDAKDQITHGHIRRVQVYAVELAKRLGVSDERQLNAIAAAALLHDMGKLAIPEHILNKPGRLSQAEFHRMKQHAGLGADLLASIRFPYPVVPIVRHHHENWDGSGYPSGIAGTDIPLGARILSVVDCFDALTSDRPYRPRLTADEAFAILRERRGSMYDPLVVDTFIQAYPEIAPTAIQAGKEAPSIFPTEDPDGHPKPLVQIRANALEDTELRNCARDVATARTLEEAFHISSRCLRQLTPATVIAYYRYDHSADSVVCTYASNDRHHLLDDLTIRLGERVTGWCAANGRTAINSDAVLDLGQIAHGFDPPLRSTVAVPVDNEGRLIGVLSAYTIKEDAFQDAHRYTFERIVKILGERIGPSDALALPNIRQFPAKT